MRDGGAEEVKREGEQRRRGVCGGGVVDVINLQTENQLREEKKKYGSKQDSFSCFSYIEWMKGR